MNKADRGYTYSEEWRRICEAREILRWPLEQRRTHLRKLEISRGKKAADELKQTMREEFERTKNER